MSGPFGSRRFQPSEPACDRVRDWVRERFALPGEAAILVTELACGVPGCPPLETVVAFWSADERRHQFKVFKPVAQMLQDDLPYAWQCNSLADCDGLGCDCC